MARVPRPHDDERLTTKKIVGRIYPTYRTLCTYNAPKHRELVYLELHIN